MMKKFFVLALIIMTGFFISGCATWSGVKQDSSQAWKSTKKVVHDATSE
jgi:predicted small secreted protein